MFKNSLIKCSTSAVTSLCKVCLTHFYRAEHSLLLLQGSHFLLILSYYKKWKWIKYLKSLCSAGYKGQWESIRLTCQQTGAARSLCHELRVLSLLYIQRSRKTKTNICESHQDICVFRHSNTGMWKITPHSRSSVVCPFNQHSSSVIIIRYYTDGCIRESEDILHVEWSRQGSNRVTRSTSVQTGQAY